MQKEGGCTALLISVRQASRVTRVEESLLQGDSSVCEGTGCATSSRGFWWGILRVAVVGQYEQEREEEGREKGHEGEHGECGRKWYDQVRVTQLSNAESLSCLGK